MTNDTSTNDLKITSQCKQLLNNTRATTNTPWLISLWNNAVPIVMTGNLSIGNELTVAPKTLHQHHERH